MQLGAGAIRLRASRVKMHKTYDHKLQTALLKLVLSQLSLSDTQKAIYKSDQEARIDVLAPAFTWSSGLESLEQTLLFQIQF